MIKQMYSSWHLVVFVLLINALCMLVSGCGSNTIKTAGQIDNSGPLGQVGSMAQEIQGVDGWINSKPFTLESLRGKVVLIDFWTYTCVNCIRTLPFLKEWHGKYADEGLVIVGVHSPEFKFEHIRENVETAVEEFGIEWAIIQDNNLETWQAFANRFWPAKYLIDKNGVIRYTHFGEGSYDETEMEIRKWLWDAGSELDGIEPNENPNPIRNKQAESRDSATMQTRELFAGLRFNLNVQTPYIIQSEMYGSSSDTPILFEDPGNHLNHFLYLHGMWLNEHDNIKHARATKDLEDYLALKFFGTSANVVLAVNDLPYKVYVTIDNEPIPLVDRGVDIEEDEDSRTYIMVDANRMYSIIDSPEYSGHEMRLSSNSNEFSIFSFTFGSYGKGP